MTTRRRAAPTAAMLRAALLAGAQAALLAATPTHADPLDDLRRAVLAFRGIGHEDVAAYRTEIRLPDEGEEDSIPLVEVWRAPTGYGVRAATKAPAAAVRSWAIFLEPLYVARSSLLDADLETGAARLREVAKVEERAERDGRVVRVAMPAAPDSQLPGFLRDVSLLEGRLDARGRLRALRLELRAAKGRPGETLDLECSWQDRAAPQPSTCAWTLPGGGRVRVTTEFRNEHGRRVPGRRRVVFPSRYDPGETEEIRIEYGPYDLAPPPDLLDAAGTFRYDANGLVRD
jgi:hypothetical protein